MWRSSANWIVFFLKAEDGIGDVAVTGVQTCALPICLRFAQRLEKRYVGLGSHLPADHQPRAPASAGEDGRIQWRYNVLSHDRYDGQPDQERDWGGVEVARA